MAYGYDKKKEIREAIEAGEHALSSLRAAKEQLDSARRWGVLDLFGGNMISGFLKHSRMSNASRCVDQAKSDLRRFQDELSDVRDLQGMDIGINDFLTFADFFFDGFLADIFVQSKISDARRNVDEAIRRVEAMLKKLRNY